MKYLLIVCMIFFVSIFLLSCGCRVSGDCKAGASVSIQAVKDDTIIMKGATALLKENDITFHQIGKSNSEKRFSVDTLHGTMNTILERDRLYFLQLGSYLSDTLFADLIVENDLWECCPTIETDFIQLGNEVICNINCDEIIVLEL